ncbi:hypothetical protein JAAARDRAFT_32057 [Jaapia argillacea MUCL 33604]|uniref:Uncharacterized protein n=1 Tax=Jaapia argillacea MUCL 33604 TaxID=933084 RepID=A0A067QC40_9AGAM|nr:hypothetical protein JAAARDRAFT_32057 [Jaapia argillacea MUCL 33604]
MFTISTAQITLNFTQVLLTPVITSASTCRGLLCTSCPGSASSAWIQEIKVTNPLRTVCQALIVTNQLLADGILVYRCYLIWRPKTLIVTLPLLLMLATAVCGFTLSSVYDHLYLTGLRNDTSPTRGWYFLGKLHIVMAASYLTISLATNVLVTTLIASRIWWLNREFEQSLGQRNGRMYRSAIAIIIESGAVYSLSLVILLVLYTAHVADNIMEMIGSAFSQLAGIISTLIILRAGLGMSAKQSTLNMSNVFVALAPSPHAADLTRDSDLPQDLETGPAGLRPVFLKSGCRVSSSSAASTTDVDTVHPSE